MNKQIFFLFFLPFLVLNFFSFAQSEALVSSTPLIIGEKVEIKSEILNENRIINIYLPYGYSPDSLKTYPVIYLLDGSINEDFLHIAGLVQFGSFSWINMIPETIVVGISNIDRKHDFTHTPTVRRHKKEFPMSGGSAKFIAFIQNELQPFIDKNYKTNKVKTLIGQSLGGLLATEILFKNPDMFDNFIILSPSLWWNGESLMKMDPKQYNSEKSVFIGVGKEGEIMERLAKELFEKLQSIKKDNTKLFYEFFEKQNHGDVLHLAAYRSFELIFRHEK